MICRFQTLIGDRFEVNIPQITPPPPATYRCRRASVLQTQDPPAIPDQTLGAPEPARTYDLVRTVTGPPAKAIYYEQEQP